jgi:hypothetical protein
MSTMDSTRDELEKLVDRHIELCERFEGSRTRGRRQAPALFTLTEGKALSDCYADLVDQALVAYEGSGFAQDLTIYALKSALVQAIAGKLDGIIAGQALGGP